VAYSYFVVNGFYYKVEKNVCGFRIISI